MASTPRKKALITGITGQDGSYLAELLLEKGYEVWGIIRRSSSFNTGRIDHLYQDPHDANVRLKLAFGDLGDASSINQMLKRVRPDEIYNLGAQSHVKVSFDIPEYTADVTGLGAVRILEAMRELDLNECRFYQASSSELYGKVVETPQTENTPFHPRSPYAAARPSLPARLPAPPPASSSATNPGCTSAISTRNATGASPATTSKRCGKCCNPRRPTTT